MNRNDYLQQVDQARQALTENPTAVEQAAVGARALLALGQPEEIGELLALVEPEARQTDPALLDIEASLALLEGRAADAIRVLEKLNRCQPDRPHAPLRLAQVLLREERVEEALARAREARDRAPDEVEVCLDVIDLFSRAGAQTEARSEAARVLSAHKGEAALQARVGMLAHSHGDLDLAVDALAAAALREDPAPEAFLPLGLIFWDNVRGPDFARAAHLFKLQRFGLDLVNLRELGWIELLSGNRSAGAALLLAGLDAFDRPPPALILEQWSAEAAGGKPEEVLAELESPRPASLHLGVARYYLVRNQPAAAEAWLRECLLRYPEDHAVRLDLARLLLEQLEAPEEALVELEQVDWQEVDDADLAAEAAELESSISTGQVPTDSPPVDRLRGSADSGVLGMHAHALDVDSAARRIWRGPDAVVTRVMQILGRALMRSVLLAGEPGVGKTALVTEVARRIASGNCPENLATHRILELSPTALQTDIKYLGEWQTKITRLVQEVRQSPGTILYIPRFHHLLGAGATRAHEEDMASALAPLLASDQLVVLADGNPEPLKRMLRTRPELDRALTLVELHEPPRNELRNILLAARSWIRRDSGPRIETATVDRALDLCARFLRHERFPAKGIDLMRAAYERAREAGRNLVTPEDAARELSAKTGLPRFLLLDAEMLDLEQTAAFFRERILGQDEALTAMLDTVARIKTGLQDPQRPLATYLFTGPTGVGKTETAKVLAAYLFGDEKRMLRFDMSEFSDHLAVERLIESRDGQAGSRGQLTGAVRENPLSVVLFDEIEKAHPRVFDLLLQVLGEGRLTDARGETVDFLESVIIMTSNLGSDRGGEGGLGFTRDRAAAEAAAIREQVQQFFRPEFMNRIDRIVAFRRLSRETLRTVALREIGGCIAREGVVRRGVVVETDPSVADLVLERGQSARYGARQLKRAVEELVSVPLARLLASQRVLSDETVRLVTREAAVQVEVVREAAPVPSPAAVAAAQRVERTAQEVREGARRAGERINYLARALAVADAQKRVEELRREMARPGFWDDARSSTSTLRLFAEQNRILDRDKTVRADLEEVALLTDLVREGHRELLAEADQRLRETEILIEEMELETLLSDPRDRRFAFATITAGGQSPEDENWVRELAQLYKQWAARRGMEVEVVGERGFRGDARGAALLHLSGPFAYGLMRSENGTHRKVFAGAGGNRAVVVARVHVVPEPVEEAAEPSALRYRASRAANPRYISMGRGVVSFRVLGKRWSLRTPYDAEKAARFAAAFAAGMEEAPPRDDALATIARNLLLFRQQLAQDPRSGHESTDTRAVLDGRIDDFILALLATEPGHGD